MEEWIEEEKDSRYEKVGKDDKGNKDKSRNDNFHLGNKILGGRDAHSRVLQRKINNDVQKHLIVDYCPAKSKGEEKNPFPIAVSYKGVENAKNSGKSAALIAASRERKIVKVKKEPIARIIELAQIQKGLYLGNLDVIDDKQLLEQRNIQTIINLSKTKLKTLQSFYAKYHRIPEQYRDLHILSVSFKDCRAITSAELKNCVKETNIMINNALERGSVLVLCETGINVSAAIVASFAIVEKGWNYNDIVDYIDTEKVQCDQRWNNLTSLPLRNLLRTL